MKRNINNLKVNLGQINERHIKVGLTILTLVLFVLGAGAPSEFGG